VKVGSTAKLTATVKNATDDLLPSVSVRFNVTGVNSTSGGSTTGTDGKATFSYVGDKDGQDTVTAYADADGNRTQDSGEPSTTTSITGLAVYGLPLTQEFQENGVTTQYFERARFEWHPGAWPERSDVMLGRLGAQVLQSTCGVGQ
jgi:hypothetical protein